MMRSSSIALVVALGLFGVAGCNGSSPAASGDGGKDGPDQGDGVQGDGGGGASGDGGAAGEIPPSGCVIGGPQCNNCIDDDGDGKTDYGDPECVGPLDNDEADFGTGIPGDNIDACKQDCFFDGNSGMGDDGCEWNLKCDPKSPGASAAKACPYDPSYKNCPTMQSKKCIDFCQSKTPNGCDCFGCCLIMGKTVYLAPTCTIAKFDDPVACPPCTQNTACTNPCDKCEVCIGKPAPDPTCPRPDAGVPDGAPPPDGGTPPPPPPSCPSGVTPCGPGGVEPAMCPPMTVCITGCCINWVP